MSKIAWAASVVLLGLGAGSSSSNAQFHEVAGSGEDVILMENIAFAILMEDGASYIKMENS